MCVRAPPAPAPRPPRSARGRAAHTHARRCAPACHAALSGGSNAATHAAAAAVALALLLAPPHAAHAVGGGAVEQELLIENVPSALSAGDGAPVGGESRSSKLRGANSKAISNCASKCITTCTRGGPGAPGLGPLSQRGELIVFKQGFRSRAYCVNECVDVCARMWNAPQPAAP